MANKYIRHGETYCGDGTSPDAATSNSGVGAWNNINVFEGTAPAYGALVAGDTVYMRSKDAAGVAITRTMTAAINVGSTAATEASPTTWILDAGTVWSGINGVLSYPNSGGNYSISIRSNNNVIAESKDGIVTVTSNTWGSAWSPFVFNTGVYAKNLKVDGAAWTVSGNVTLPMHGAIVENITVVIGQLNSQPVFLPLEYNYSCNTIINPDITINGAYLGVGVFGSAVYNGGGNMVIVGGQIKGTAADAGAYLTQSSPNHIKFVGTLIPRTMQLAQTTAGKHDHLEVIGCDGDGTGGYLGEYWGWATSRTDNYPPTLSATLPDSGLTAWAWRVYPKAASVSTPMRLLMAKLFTDTEGTKTITLEFLVATTFALTKKTAWMTVDYLDATTGLPKHMDTRNFDDSALDASTAGWSATTWGMVGFNKRKMSITTPTAIKQNTLVTVTLFGVKASTTADDILFVDPDFAVM